jgi:hypothetical protein
MLDAAAESGALVPSGDHERVGVNRARHPNFVLTLLLTHTNHFALAKDLSPSLTRGSGGDIQYHDGWRSQRRLLGCVKETPPGTHVYSGC